MKWLFRYHEEININEKYIPILNIARNSYFLNHFAIALNESDTFVMLMNTDQILSI